MRWSGIIRPYTNNDVLKLRGTYNIEYSVARMGSEKLWDKLNDEKYDRGLGALGAMTGSQAVQEVDAGLEAIYISGWQVAADANLSGNMYPDQSLYPVNSVPNLVKSINNALLRADQIQVVNNVENKKNYLVPLIADAEAGFGGNLNAYELTKAMIEAGASGVHFEDQLSSAKKCGHLGIISAPAGQELLCSGNIVPVGGSLNGGGAGIYAGTTFATSAINKP